eukprot:Gb_13314 [translate_table: standard]
MDCVEKLQFLSSPGERARKLHEIPEVIADPNLDSDHGIDEEEKLADNSQGGKWGEDKDGEEHRLDEQEKQKCSESMVSGSNTISAVETNVGGMKGLSQSSGESTLFASNSDQQQERAQKCKSSSQLAIFTEKADTCSTESSSEAEVVWHYQDPTGRIRGPFSMLQLRKWNRTGLFPLNLKIWKTIVRQVDSILLTDALDGRFEVPITKEGDDGLGASPSFQNPMKLPMIAWIVVQQVALGINQAEEPTMTIFEKLLKRL